MEKPIILRRKEFMDTMEKTVNESDLPLLVMEPIVAELLGIIRNNMEIQYQQEKAQYEKALAEEALKKMQEEEEAKENAEMERMKEVVESKNEEVPV